MHGSRPNPAWYPSEGYPYAPYGPPVIAEAEFVGAPPPAVVTYVPEQSFPVATVVGIIVAGAVASYFIYSASKAGGRVQKKINRAALRILGAEAKRQGARAVQHVGEAAGDMFAHAIDRRTASRRKPRVIHYEAVPVRD